MKDGRVAAVGPRDVVLAGHRGPVNEWFKQVCDLGLQLLADANGDAAIDELIAAHAFAAGQQIVDRRTTAIHSQFVR